jgi:predicted transcriptional regulator
VNVPSLGCPVQTTFNVLHRKGRVRRTLNGRAFRYRALVSKEAVLQQAVRELVERLFGGSSEELVMRLIKSRQVDPARIAELSRTLALRDRLCGQDDPQARSGKPLTGKALKDGMFTE